jgi:AAA+ superfamily predicted ATPase
MKYHLLLCLGIIAFAQANTPIQDPFPHHQTDKETGEGWKPFSEANPEEINHKEGHTASGILKDKILTAKRKPLDPELAELVINLSPQSTQQLAQKIVECVENPSKKCPAKALIVGAPGVGKTTYIQAVAERAGLPLIKINAPFVADQYKDSGSQNLKSIFKPILETKNKIIVAFDELHCLTDGHKNINNPNQNTAEAFWTLLDQCSENPNIILVGIMNDGSNMPEPLKSRFRMQGHLFKINNEELYKYEILEYYLDKITYRICQACKKKISRLLPSSEARIIEEIVNLAEEIASLGKDEWEVTREDLRAAIERYDETRPIFEKKIIKIEPLDWTKHLK